MTLVACSAPSTSDTQDATTIEAFYAGNLFTASYRELASGGDTANGSATVLYQSDPGIVDGTAFVSVLEAMGADVPVWREVQVSGNQCAFGELCAVPIQFTSAEQILASVGAGPDQVHLVSTPTRCSVRDVRPSIPEARGWPAPRQPVASW